MFIDAQTSRENLLAAIYGERDLFARFCDADRDPEFMTDDELRDEIQNWIADGDECAQ